MYTGKGNIEKLRFWCFKILPLVYDDSLSYYEVLCKVSAKLNEVIDNVNEIPNYIDSKIEEALTDEHIIEILSQFVTKIQDAISANNESTNTNASKDYSVGEMLWWNDVLYKVSRAIDAGDTLIDGTNLVSIDFETLFNEFVDEVKHDITANDDGTNATATQSWTVGQWLWLNDNLYIVTRNITQGNAYVFTGDNANVKATTVENEQETIYYPNDKKLSIHGKISDYTQITTLGDVHTYNPTTSAITIEHLDG